MRDENGNIVIPPEIWQTVCSDDGYFMRFNDLRQLYTSNFDTWHRLETDRMQYGVEPKFRTFAAFKQSRFRYYNEKFAPQKNEETDI
jgi:hypothetical protein